jgi:hypothetical protein
MLPAVIPLHHFHQSLLPVQQQPDAKYNLDLFIESLDAHPCPDVEQAMKPRCPETFQ